MATVPSEISSLDFTGTGGVVDFPLTFPIFEKAHLVVELTLTGSTVATLQVLGVDYTVDAAPSAAPTVTMTVAPPVASTLHIERTVPITQLTNLLTSGPYSPAVMTQVADKGTMVDQQLERRIAELEALASLTSIAVFDGQLVEFALHTDAVDVENSFPFNVAVVAPAGKTVTGVVIVKVDGVGNARDSIQLLVWSWAGNVLSVQYITGLEPDRDYTFRILCTHMVP